MFKVNVYVWAEETKSVLPSFHRRISIAFSLVADVTRPHQIVINIHKIIPGFLGLVVVDCEAHASRFGLGNTAICT
ncbi:hypothetical protein ASD31_15465 [Rhizobium sp. Root482]|nr:hypothetical protein ASD31_15465 [Rhizobium sp. Root482]